MCPDIYNHMLENYLTNKKLCRRSTRYMEADYSPSYDIDLTDAGATADSVE